MRLLSSGPALALLLLSGAALCGCAAHSAALRGETPGAASQAAEPGEGAGPDSAAGREAGTEAAPPHGEDVVRWSCDRPALTHRVRPGENLWRISRNHGVPMDEVARCSGVSDPTRILAGQLLTIPRAVAARPGPGTADPGEADEEEIALADAGFDRLPAAVEQPVRPGAVFLWPVEGTLSSGFGIRSGRMHSGLDLTAPPGTEIRASRDGIVLYSGSGFRGYGNVVILDHGDGFLTLYAHNRENLVSVDERVQAGQTIALVGRTGNATAAHLHFEIREGDRPVDPLTLLPSEPLISGAANGASPGAGAPAGTLAR